MAAFANSYWARAGQLQHPTAEPLPAFASATLSSELRNSSEMAKLQSGGFEINSAANRLQRPSPRAPKWDVKKQETKIHTSKALNSLLAPSISPAFTQAEISPVYVTTLGSTPAVTI